MLITRFSDRRKAVPAHPRLASRTLLTLLSPLAPMDQFPPAVNNVHDVRDQQRKPLDKRLIALSEHLKLTARSPELHAANLSAHIRSTRVRSSRVLPLGDSMWVMDSKKNSGMRSWRGVSTWVIPQMASVTRIWETHRYRDPKMWRWQLEEGLVAVHDCQKLADYPQKPRKRAWIMYVAPIFQ